MKNLLYRMSLGVFLLFALGACSEEQDNAAVQILPTGQGTFTDPRDGVVYKWVRYGKLEWMAENLRAEAEKGKYEVYVESYQTSQERELQRKRNFERFGYWYDFAAAESAVPDGWRLPTDEDWQYLERALGMSPEEVDRMDWRGDRQGETVQQKSGMDLMPGGFFDYDQLTYGVAYTPEFMGFYVFFSFFSMFRLQSFGRLISNKISNVMISISAIQFRIKIINPVVSTGSRFF